MPMRVVLATLELYRTEMCRFGRPVALKVNIRLLTKKSPTDLRDRVYRIDWSDRY